MTNQSQGTSRKQVPATFKRVAWKSGTYNFDMGCGKYPELFTHALARKGVHNLPLDIPQGIEPQESIDYLGSHVCDTVTCNNVLNVIRSMRTRLEVIRACHGVLKSNGIAYFLIHQGDRSGVGRKTRDGWQNNKLAAKYVREIQHVFGRVKRQGNLIAACPEDHDFRFVR